MIVFNTFFKVLYKHKLLVGINAIIFLIMGVVFSFNPPIDENFAEGTNSLKRIHVAIIYNYETDRSDGLIRFLHETFTIVDVEYNDIEIKNALFFDQAQYILIINEDGLQAYHVPNSNSGYLVENSINNFLNTFDLIKSANTTNDIEEIINQTIDNLNIYVDVTVETDYYNIPFLRTYFNFATYGILGAVMTGVAVVMITFNKKMVYERTVVSSTKITKRNMYFTTASLVFSIGTWVAVLIIGFVASGISEINEAFKLFMINSFIFTMVCCALGFLIGQFIKKIVVLGSVVSVVTLVLAFISGVFVPQFALNNITITIARFTPTYWFVRNNDLIADMSVFSSEPLVSGILIQIGFALAFTAIALAYSKFKMEKM